MNDKTITFQADEEGMKLMAVFVAQLVREGLTFTVENRATCFLVTLTGGF